MDAQNATLPRVLGSICGPKFDSHTRQFYPTGWEYAETALGILGVYRHLRKIVPGEIPGPQSFSHFSCAASEGGRKGTSHVLANVPVLRILIGWNPASNSEVEGEGKSLCRGSERAYSRRSYGKRWSYGRGCVANTFSYFTASTRRIFSLPSHTTLATLFGTWIQTQEFPAPFQDCFYRSFSPPSDCWSEVVFKAPRGVRS